MIGHASRLFTRLLGRIKNIFYHGCYVITLRFGVCVSPRLPTEIGVY